MPFATRPRGTRIHYEIQGESRGSTQPTVDGRPPSRPTVDGRPPSRPTAVLIQGLGLSSRFWFDVPDRLATGPDPWRIITPDHRGVGRSDRPWGPYFMGTLADDVVGVLDHAGVDRAYVVGLSLGGMVAQHVALRHPSRVAGLVLLATTAGVPHLRVNPVAIANFMSLPLTGRLKKPHVDPAFARLLLSEADVPRSRELLAGWPDALKTEPTSLAGFIAHFGAVAAHSTGWRLRKIQCPTVVVTGDDDQLLPQENSRWLARLVPGAHLEVIPGGHILPASDPEVVRRALGRARAMAGDEPAAVAAGVAPGAAQMLSAPVRSK